MQNQISCSLSSLISTLVFFSDWRRTVSSKFFDTQVPSISTEELVLPHHARCVLSLLCCNGHSLLLGSYLCRIGRIENSSCSACGHSSRDISHLILHCPATDSALLTLWRLSVSVRPLVQNMESFSTSGVPWSSAMPPTPGRGRLTNNNNQLERACCPSAVVLKAVLRKNVFCWESPEYLGSLGRPRTISIQPNEVKDLATALVRLLRDAVLRSRADSV